MAPGAFERAQPSPRADADPGPTGGTAPDSPRAFLAAMEDGVYGRWRRGRGAEPTFRRRPVPLTAPRRPEAATPPGLLWGAGAASGGAARRAFQAIV